MSQRVIVDPPVGPFSEPAEIRAWVTQLEKWLAQSEQEDAHIYREAIEEAKGWLERSAG